jgi:hypothetical protein
MQCRARVAAVCLEQLLDIALDPVRLRQRQAMPIDKHFCELRAGLTFGRRGDQPCRIGTTTANRDEYME